MSSSPRRLCLPLLGVALACAAEEVAEDELRGLGSTVHQLNVESASLQLQAVRVGIAGGVLHQISAFEALSHCIGSIQLVKTAEADVPDKPVTGYPPNKWLRNPGFALCVDFVGCAS